MKYETFFRPILLSRGLGREGQAPPRPLQYPLGLTHSPTTSHQPTAQLLPTCSAHISPSSVRKLLASLYVTFILRQSFKLRRHRCPKAYIFLSSRLYFTRNFEKSRFSGGGLFRNEFREILRYPNAHVTHRACALSPCARARHTHFRQFCKGLGW